ncbi:filament integrity protein FraC [Sodalinema sp.]|uniref:filament integrity protein FraC n=1 Tax=Sodalinema sp. TaxID=3080550 RepID=UPI00396F4FF6
MVLPLRAIASQILLLLVSVAIESTVFHRRLAISRRMSVQYALVIDLLCIILGWIGFFILVDNFATHPWVIQVMGYLFTGRFVARPGYDGIEPVLAIATIIVFFASFFIKSQCLYLLQRFKIISLESQVFYEHFNSSKTERLIRYEIRVDQDRTILLGHGLSHGAIFILLVVMILGLGVATE